LGCQRNAVAVSLFPEASTPLIDTSPWVGAPDGRNGLRTKGNALLFHRANGVFLMPERAYSYGEQITVKALISKTTI